MKKFRLILILAVMLALLMSTAASAQTNAPTAVDVLSANPNTGPVTAEIDWTLAFSDPSGAYTAGNNIAVCFYYEEGESGWSTNIRGTTPNIATGDSYISVNGDNCPALGGLDSIWYYATTTTGFNGLGSETFTWNDVAVPNVTTGTKDFSARAWTGTDCDGSRNNLDYPGEPTGTCATAIGVGRSTIFTVQAPPATVYASDSANCGGYGVVGISCFNSLDQAVSKANGYSSTLVRVVGSLTLDADGTTISTAFPTTLGGISTPIVEPISGCSGVISVTNGATVQNITIDGTDCPSATGLTISGASTVNNVTIQNFSTGTGLNNSNASTVIQSSRFQNNGIGILTSGTTIQNNTIQNNAGDGIQVSGGSTIIQDNDLLNNSGDGIQVQPSFSGTIQENHISQSGAYGVNFTGSASGSPTIQWNNIVTSGSGSLRNGSSSIFIGGNYFGDNASTAALGGFDGALVGSPFNRSTPGINAGNIQSQSIGASSNYDFGAVSITNGTGGGLTFVVIDLSNDTPFGVGLDPYQGTQCSNYYDVYINGTTGSTSPITIRMDVNAGACQDAGGPIDDLCTAGTSAPIRWVNSDSSIWMQTSNMSCDTPAPRTWVQGDIEANLLGSTGFAVMGSSSPTSIALTSLTASAARNTWIPVALIAVSMVGVGALTWLRRKRQG